MRRAHGGLRGPRPAPAVGSVSRRPCEEALQHVALLAIDDAQAYALGGADLPEPRHRATLFAQEPQHCEFQNLWATPGHRGAAFVTAVASKVFRRRPDATEMSRSSRDLVARPRSLASASKTLERGNLGSFFAHNSA